MIVPNNNNLLDDMVPRYNATLMYAFYTNNDFKSTYVQNKGLRHNSVALNNLHMIGEWPTFRVN